MDSMEECENYTSECLRSYEWTPDGHETGVTSATREEIFSISGREKKNSRIQQTHCF